MIKILNAEPAEYSEAARTILREIGSLVERPYAREELLQAVRNFDVLIVRLGHKIDRDVIDAAPQLKVVVTATTGTDHIDMKYAAQRGIMVLSLRGEVDFLRTIPATAELTWALLLALVRHIPAAFDSACRGVWTRDTFKGTQLKDKRLGILGAGRIGCQVAQYGQAFNMKVGAYDQSGEFSKNVNVPQVRSFLNLEELLRWSDILSIHLPLTAETNHLIDDEKLMLMSPGGILINTSRGAIVREDALLSALNSGHLFGAALDVVENELSFREDNPLAEYARTHNTLLLSPHIGGATDESMAETELFMAEKLRTFFQLIKDSK